MGNLKTAGSLILKLFSIYKDVYMNLNLISGLQVQSKGDMFKMNN